MAVSWESSPVLAAIRAYVDDSHGGNIRAAARSMGVQYQTFFMWYKGKRAPRLTTLGNVLEILKASGKLNDSDIPTEEFTESRNGEEVSQRTLGVKVLNDFEFIPRAVAVAGCGESFQTEPGISSLYAFRKDFLRREGINVKNAIMMYVSGDSMEPTIKDRDTILVDQDDRDLREGYVYLIGLSGALMVKRVQKAINGWQLKSDNPAYSPTTVQGQELDQMQVYGRVRWFSRVI